VSKDARPIDLDRRRDVLRRMASLEREVKELRKQVAGPEQVAQLALAELQSNERGFKQLAEALRRTLPWLHDQLVLQGVILKLGGTEADPADALAVYARDGGFAKDSFKAAVLARLAEFEDELIK
jgi:hypothetical protein